MRNSLLIQEALSIFQNKKLLIPIIAVLFIPVLYTGMFLHAFWDPYARLDELPVAVVNMDEGATMEGKDIDLGDVLVKKLKEGKNFHFNFVDKKEGERGLKNQKYYMTIEIPKDFSENATTLLDEKPKKLELVYMPNESYNFLSAQIGGTAVEKIKAALSEKVSETYAETMFDKVGELADGVKKAGEGAGKLNDGAGELKKGSKALYDNLEMLAGKSIEFNNGMNTAYSGSKELSYGSSELASGLGKLQDGGQKLQSASSTLQGGQESLHEGISKTKDGLNEVNGKLPDLVNGTGQLKAGADELAAKQGELKNGIDSVGSGIGELQKGAGKLQVGAGRVREGASNLKAGVDELKTGANDVSDGASQLAGGLQEWQKSSVDVANGASEVNEGIIQLNNQLQPLLSSPALPDDQKAILKATLDQLIAGSGKVKNGTAGLSEAAGEITTNGNALSAGASKLSAGAGALSDGATKLAGGANELSAGAGGLSAGLASASEGTTKLSDGAGKLAAGAGELSGGLEAVNDGQQKLGGAIGQLSAGIGQLEDGSGKLVAGHSQFSTGLSALGQGLGSAKTGADKLAGGADNLSNGLGQLAAGSEAMQSGAGKLSEGARKVADGNSKLANGSSELAEKLQDGADKADIKAGKANFNMMADPVKVDNKRLNEVPNYGTGFAPYFLSLGLFVGALLISIVFPLKEAAGVPTSGVRWYSSKTAILAGVGILQSLFADAILLWGLGLEVDNVGLFILFTIITSFTFLALIQFLVTLFGDPGRFIAILILILQLTTSAGTFPLELIPGWLQGFNLLLPMTYSVSGFKAIISSGDIAYMWQNAGVLFGYIAVLSVGTLLFFRVMHRRTYYKANEQ
ncbi:YhgE/Pip family protein [Bacillus massilinigeriensis]|uniref:YhgE/Pip family protein n=1 Tax=Bacillus mediterraneensis TaxID=1805474 RepID=UPI0008F8CE9D|nr:YhgE/Pip domain-containing protein [Bacillus mediterraneensis]